MEKKKEKLQKGFVIESVKEGYFYHRLGYWVKYLSPADAYVWTEEEVSTIIQASEKESWEMKVLTLHPAIHDVKSGITVLTESGIPYQKIIRKLGKVVEVPLNGGKILDLGKEINSMLGTRVSFVGSSMSL